MLTFFSIPKPFTHHTEIIQTNAIRSWMKLRPNCEIVLLGNETGVSDFSHRNGIVHVPDIQCSDYGTPLVSDAFKIAQACATHPFLCYVNCDIIFTCEILSALKKIHYDRFVMVGQRWNVDLSDYWDFDSPYWEIFLLNFVTTNGTLHPPTGIDYFVFPKGTFENLPEFTVGRPGWDNWMIYNAEIRKIPVIDATQFIKAIHQNHDYKHVPHSIGQKWHGPEGQKNLSILEKIPYRFSIQDADKTLSNKGLASPERSLANLVRRLIKFLALNPPFDSFLLAIRRIWRLIRRT